MSDAIDHRTRIELTIRAADIARESLKLLDAHETFYAKLVLAQIARKLMELDEFVTRMQGGGSQK